jgi:dephospho-CoA kinase
MIIGLVGYARSGKDTVAEYLVEHHNFTRQAFADPMREALIRLDPRINVGEMKGVALTEAVKNLGWDALKEHSEDVRHLLQRMGTEVGRQMFGKDVWVKKALEILLYKPDVVFSDVRFHNEADAILSAGGRLWKVTRPGLGPINDHLSDSEMDSYRDSAFDLIIINDSTKEELFEELNKTMQMLQAHNGS